MNDIVASSILKFGRITLEVMRNCQTSISDVERSKICYYYCEAEKRLKAHFKMKSLKRMAIITLIILKHLIV